jgi:hypothetical protein
MGETGIEEVDEDGGHADEADDDEERPRILQETEGRARIRDVDDPDGPVGGPDIAGFEGEADNPLRELIEEDDDGSQGKEPGIAAASSEAGAHGASRLLRGNIYHGDILLHEGDRLRQAEGRPFLADASHERIRWTDEHAAGRRAAWQHHRPGRFGQTERSGSRPAST